MSSLAAGAPIDFRVGGVQECRENIPAQAPKCPRCEGSSNYSADQIYESDAHSHWHREYDFTKEWNWSGKASQCLFRTVAVVTGLMIYAPNKQSWPLPVALVVCTTALALLSLDLRFTTKQASGVSKGFRAIESFGVLPGRDEWINEGWKLAGVPP